MKELSIFIDESGDFGEYSYHSPWYIISMVFHDQEKSIEEPLEYLERRKIFNKMLTFIRQSGISYKSFYIEKKHIEDVVEASGKLSKMISGFIREHYDYFLSFDIVKVYYDNGQIELNKILSTIFNAFLPRVEFRKVTPSDYRLFQAADMICTFELLKLKIAEHKVSKSEEIFFGNVNDLKRNYIKIINRQDIDHGKK